MSVLEKHDFLAPLGLETRIVQPIVWALYWLQCPGSCSTSVGL